MSKGKMKREKSMFEKMGGRNNSGRDDLCVKGNGYGIQIYSFGRVGTVCVLPSSEGAIYRKRI